MEFGHDAKRVSKRSLLGNYLVKKYENVFASIDNAVPPGDREKLLSNKDLVQGIATSLFDATWERFKTMREDDTKTIDDDFQEYINNETDLESNDSFWKDENFRQEYEIRSASSEEEREKPNVKTSLRKQAKDTVEETREHFIDMVIDRLILSILPDAVSYTHLDVYKRQVY